MSEKAADPGSELVEAIRTGLPPGVELDEREEALLDLSARQARDVGTRPWAYWKFELGRNLQTKAANRPA